MYPIIPITSMLTEVTSMAWTVIGANDSRIIYIDLFKLDVIVIRSLDI